MKNDAYPEVPLTLAVALAPWAGLVAAGTQAGVFLRLPVEAFLALAAFATLFAASVVLVDARVRGWLATRGAASAWTAALGAAVLLVASGVGLSRGRDIEIAAAPWAALLLLVAPLTVAAAVSAALAAWRWGPTARAWPSRPPATDALRRSPVRSPASRAPAPHRAWP